MNWTRTLLSSYFQILEENKTAKYLQSKKIPVDFNKSESIDDLWKKHNDKTRKMKINDNEIKQSLLDLKIEIASRIFRSCCFCERQCMMDRTVKCGNCGVMQSRVSSEFLHMGEETVLVPSHTIFFSGCTFHCVFCQNWDISQFKTGSYIEPSILAEIISKRKNQGSKNVNWVGGDPTPNLLYILQVLNICNVNIPQIWNSNMYCSTETLKLLENIIDVYLTDFKYGNDKCAKRLALVDNYLNVVKRNHIIAYVNGELIIRHLVMPNHIECCSKPILRWIAENIPKAVVNIMGQYHPEYHAAEYKEISRNISNDEVLQVKDFASDLGIHEI
ncbi:MAG: radical SAM protein [Candidatus Thermoplasmatota archaeon]|jgi:putative pyruvate formate lyase activating enzyme|nr:radical SAM protein [Candidatus Thermoplasmatota archaeon]